MSSLCAVINDSRAGDRSIGFGALEKLAAMQEGAIQNLREDQDHRRFNKHARRHFPSILLKATIHETTCARVVHSSQSQAIRTWPRTSTRRSNAHMVLSLHIK